jgi:hypothetical protein
MKRTKQPGIVTFGDKSEPGRRREFTELLKMCPIPDDEMLMNLGLFLTPQTLSRVLFMDFLYRQALDVQGIVVEFGCRWGQNLSLFTALRGIYEPFNRLRKVVGFDLFSGLPHLNSKDGNALRSGMYSTTTKYEAYLAKVLAFQEQESPLSHLEKHCIVKGDASVQIRRYLRKHPETMVALAYFDLDLYRPTRDCLKAIRDRLTRGSVIGFDELNDPLCPGETLALKEVLGLGCHSVRRFPYNGRTSYLIVGE